MNSTFRDPSGNLLKLDNHIIRIINQYGIQDFETFRVSSVIKKYVDSGSFINTQILDETKIQDILRNKQVEELFKTTSAVTIVEHQCIPFASFPYEWTPGMLHAAAKLHLDLAIDLLNEGLGLKDATPYNVLFKGAKSVFVDILSIEKRNAGDAIWLPYAQFMRMFLLPLLVNKYFSIPLDQIFLTRRDGIEAEEVYNLCSMCQKGLPPFFTMVSMPKWLTNKNRQNVDFIYQRKILKDTEKASYILLTLFNSLKNSLNKLAPKLDKTSVWSDYMTISNNYSDEQFNIKGEFVSNILKEYQPKKVLDVGCNTGYFSILSAQRGASVVAVDYDPVVVGNLWHKANEMNLDILPLVGNLARPSPSVGWRNKENSSFLDRAAGYFDCVLMLAVIHHMMVSEGIPLTEIINLAAELTTDILIIEFVGPTDSQFKRLTRGRDYLFEGLDNKKFEDICRKDFLIVKSLQLETSQRWLYLLRKK